MHLGTLIDTEEDEHCGHEVPTAPLFSRFGLPVQIEKNGPYEEQSTIEVGGQVGLLVQVHQLRQGLHLDMENNVTEHNDQVQQHQDAQHKEQGTRRLSGLEFNVLHHTLLRMWVNYERRMGAPPSGSRAVPVHQALPMILNMPVPHSGHLPFMALRPLAIVTSPASFMLRLALHFTQYASTTAAISSGV